MLYYPAISIIKNKEKLGKNMVLFDRFTNYDDNNKSIHLLSQFLSYRYQLNIKEALSL